jgi:hypothetical protein
MPHRVLSFWVHPLMQLVVIPLLLQQMRVLLLQNVLLLGFLCFHLHIFDICLMLYFPMLLLFIKVLLVNLVFVGAHLPLLLMLFAIVGNVVGETRIKLFRMFFVLVVFELLEKYVTFLFVHFLRLNLQI